MDEKKERYTPAQKKAIEKYMKNSVEQIKVYVPSGKKETIKEAAKAAGESVNAYINKAIDERLTFGN